MGEFRVVPNIEFSDAYEQAKADTLKAKASIERLTADQQKKLVRELFGMEAVDMFSRIIQNR
ncbi:MAG: hypothetical protein MSA25_00405 [Clostridiales bacterium]|nr:hypothetical protein [Clostridiales bacterium]